MTTTPAAAGSRIARTFSLLRRNPDFTKVYSAQLVSFMGDWFATVALLGLVRDHTGSEASPAIVLAAQMLPLAIASPFAGVVLDRIDRRAVMIAADIARAVLALGYLTVRSEDTVWVAFACTIGISAISAFFEPAVAASLPNLVKQEDLPAANVLIGSAWGTMLAVGAALGGLVATVLGREAAFFGDALSFAISAALLLGVRARFSTPRARERGVTILAGIREAARYARRNRRVLALLVVKGGFGVAGGVIGLLAIFSQSVFEAGDAGTGILYSARGVGALVGPFLFRSLVGMHGRRLFIGIALAFTTTGVGYMAFGLAPNLGLAAVAALVAHLGGGAQWTFSSYGLQRFTDDRVRGRIFAFDYGFVTLSLAASVTVVGLLSERFGPRPVAVGVASLAIVWAALWSLATRGVWDDDPAPATAESP